MAVPCASHQRRRSSRCLDLTPIDASTHTAATNSLGMVVRHEAPCMVGCVSLNVLPQRLHLLDRAVRKYQLKQLAIGRIGGLPQAW
eukprot:363384-Chlamydomonas_euryale.AAC.20